MADTVWTGDQFDKLYLQSGEFESTIKTSGFSLNNSTTGVSFDSINTLTSGTSSNKLILQSGQFTSTVKASKQYSTSTRSLKGVSVTGDFDTLSAGTGTFSNPDKNYLDSGQFTNTVKDSKANDSFVTGISYDFPDTMWTHGSAGTNMILESGTFTSTVKTSINVGSIDNQPEDVSFNQTDTLWLGKQHDTLYLQSGRFTSTLKATLSITSIDNLPTGIESNNTIRMGPFSINIIGKASTLAFGSPHASRVGGPIDGMVGIASTLAVGAPIVFPADDTLWSGLEGQKLYLTSGNFTLTLKDSQSVGVISAEPEGISYDGTNTPWCSENVPHALFLQSGQFTSTLKTSLLTIFIAGSPQGISSDGFNALWISDNPTDTMFLQSGQFTSTVKTSQAAPDSIPSDISWDGINTPIAGDGSNKLYLQSGRFTGIVKTSQSISAIDSSITGISWDGSNTSWSGGSADKLYLTSGQFTSTLLFSLGVNSIDAAPTGIEANNIQFRISSVISPNGILSTLIFGSDLDLSIPGTIQNIILTGKSSSLAFGFTLVLPALSLGNTLWAAGTSDTLFLHSGEFTSTVIASLNVNTVDSALQGISFDGVDTLWIGSSTDTLYVQSGAFTSTIKTTKLIGTIDLTPTGITANRGKNTPWIGNSADKLYLASGQFEFTLKDSLAVNLIDSSASGITYDDSNTPWSGNAADKLYLQSGQFTTVLKFSLSVQSIEAGLNDISWNGTDTLFIGSTDRKLYLQSGQFDSILKTSQTIFDVDQFAAGIDTDDIISRLSETAISGPQLGPHMPWIGATADKLYLQSGIFTGVLVTSESIGSIDLTPTGISFDGTNTPWCGQSGDKLYLQSGQHTSTLKTSLTVFLAESAVSGISWDGTDTPWIGFGSDKLYLQSGQFTGIVKTSFSVGSIDLVPQGISYDGVNDTTPWVGSNDDKLYLTSGQFESTLKASQATADSNPTGISYDGLNTPWCGSTNDKLYIQSGQFESTIKTSLSVQFIDFTVNDIESEEVTFRLGTANTIRPIGKSSTLAFGFLALIDPTIVPTWTTGSGSLGSVRVDEPFSVTVEATDSPGDSLNMVLTLGSLPDGLILNIPDTSPGGNIFNFIGSSIDLETHSNQINDGLIFLTPTKFIVLGNDSTLTSSDLLRGFVQLGTITNEEMSLGPRVFYQSPTANQSNSTNVNSGQKNKASILKVNETKFIIMYKMRSGIDQHFIGVLIGEVANGVINLGREFKVSNYVEWFNPVPRMMKLTNSKYVIVWDDSTGYLESVDGPGGWISKLHFVVFDILNGFDIVFGIDHILNLPAITGGSILNEFSITSLTSSIFLFHIPHDGSNVIAATISGTTITFDGAGVQVFATVGSTKLIRLTNSKAILSFVNSDKPSVVIIDVTGTTISGFGAVQDASAALVAVDAKVDLVRVSDTEFYLVVIESGSPSASIRLISPRIIKGTVSGSTVTYSLETIIETTTGNEGSIFSELSKFGGIEFINQSKFLVGYFLGQKIINGPFLSRIRIGNGPSVNSISQGVIEGTPTTEGTFNFDLRIDDGIHFITQSFSIVVASSNTKPAWITNDNLGIIKVGDIINIAVQASDIELDTLTMSVIDGDLPPGITFTPGGPIGTLGGIVADTGSFETIIYKFDLGVSDGTNEIVVKEFELRVIPIQGLTWLTTTLAPIEIDTSTSIDLDTIDNNDNCLVLRLSSGTLPPGMTLSSSPVTDRDMQHNITPISFPNSNDKIRKGFALTNPLSFEFIQVDSGDLKFTSNQLTEGLITTSLGSVVTSDSIITSNTVSDVQALRVDHDAFQIIWKDITDDAVKIISKEGDGTIDSGTFANIFTITSSTGANDIQTVNIARDITIVAWRTSTNTIKIWAGESGDPFGTPKEITSVNWSRLYDIDSISREFWPEKNTKIFLIGKNASTGNGELLIIDSFQRNITIDPAGIQIFTTVSIGSAAIKRVTDDRVIVAYNDIDNDYKGFVRLFKYNQNIGISFFEGFTTALEYTSPTIGTTNPHIIAIESNDHEVFYVTASESDGTGTYTSKLHRGKIRSNDELLMIGNIQFDNGTGFTGTNQVINIDSLDSNLLYIGWQQPSNLIGYTIIDIINGFDFVDPPNFIPILDAFGENEVTAKLISTKFVTIASAPEDSIQNLFVQVGDISGTSVIFGPRWFVPDPGQKYKNDALSISINRVDDTHFLAVWQQTSPGNTWSAVVGQVTGTTITFGTPVDAIVFQGGFSASFVERISNTQFLLSNTDSNLAIRVLIDVDIGTLSATINSSSTSETSEPMMAANFPQLLPNHTLFLSGTKFFDVAGYNVGIADLVGNVIVSDFSTITQIYTNDQVTSTTAVKLSNTKIVVVLQDGEQLKISAIVVEVNSDHTQIVKVGRAIDIPYNKTRYQAGIDDGVPILLKRIDNNNFLLSVPLGGFFLPAGSLDTMICQGNVAENSFDVNFTKMTMVASWNDSNGVGNGPAGISGLDFLGLNNILLTTHASPLDFGASSADDRHAIFVGTFPVSKSTALTGTLSGTPTTEGIFNFTLEIDNGQSIVQQPFSIEIQGPDIPQISVAMTGEMQEEWQKWNDPQLIPEVDLFEPADPDFGRVAGFDKIDKFPKILITNNMPDLDPVNLIALFDRHHEDFDVFLAPPQVAVARDDATGAIKYEVIYNQVVDRQEGSVFDIPAVYASRFPNDIDAPNITLSPETISRNFQHLRTEIASFTANEVLPEWMTDEQILGDSSSILGWIPAIPIAFVLPGKGQDIIDTITDITKTEITLPLRPTTFDGGTSIFDGNATTFDNKIQTQEFITKSLGHQFTGRLFKVDRYLFEPGISSQRIWVKFQSDTKNPIWNTTVGSLGVFKDSTFATIPLLAISPNATTLKYTLLSGSLPPGLILNPITGIISGIPTVVTVPIIFHFSIRAQDAIITVGGSTTFDVMTMILDGGTTTFDGTICGIFSSDRGFDITIRPNTATTFDLDLMTLDGDTTTFDKF